MAAIDSRPGIRPRPTLGRQLDIWARRSFPASSTIILLLLTQAPLDIGGQAEMLPAAALCCVWFWSLFRPSSMPPAIVFLIGVLTDLLGYLPLGSGVLTLLAAHGVAIALRRGLSQHGFAAIWLVFAAVAVCGALVLWLLATLLTVRLLPLVPSLFVAALAAALFPILAVPFGIAHRSVANPERA